MTASWGALVIALPLLGALFIFLGRRALLLAVTAAGGTMSALAMLLHDVAVQGPHRLLVGGWGAPLGIDLVVDGIAALMLAMTAAVMLTAGIVARGTVPAARHPELFALFGLLWAGLNALFLTGDLFNLYVTLEIVALAAVALTAFGRQPAAVRAALDYLYVSLLGSLLYLMGVAIAYRSFGTLDLALLGAASTADAAGHLAFALMVTGLLFKAALVPLHFWLPAAHANALPAISALLSAVVVKAAFYAILRLWLELGQPLIAAELLAMLGLAAIAWGSIGALVAERLKQLVAYSTVAQLGYLFVALPLLDAEPDLLAAILLFALAHALAKAALFLAAGTITAQAGEDRLTRLAEQGRASAPAVFAFALAGISLVGLPPTLGFVAKWLLLEGAMRAGAWWLAAALIAGSLLAAAYIFRVLARLCAGSGPATTTSAVAGRGWAALVLALATLCLGFGAEPLRRALAQAALGAAGDL